MAGNSNYFRMHGEDSEREIDRNKGWDATDAQFMKITLHLLLFINNINMLGMKVTIKVQSTPRRQAVL